MGQSWNHRIARMPFDEEQTYARLGWTCAGRANGSRCPERATWTASYDYVTGKRGRVSSSDRHLCDGHAQRFAAQHDLELDVTPQRDYVTTERSTRLFDEIKSVKP